MVNSENAELVPGVGAQRVLRHELVRHLQGEVVIEAASDVDSREFLPLRGWVLFEFASLPCEVGLLGVRLGTDRYVLAGSHRHRPGDQTGCTGDEDLPGGRRGGGDADDQAGRGDEAVVGAEHRRP